VTTQETKEKKIDRTKEFVKWAMYTPGVFHYSEAELLEQMKDSDTTIGTAWLAWQAAWRIKS
jgi:hypothetical protein